MIGLNDVMGATANALPGNGSVFGRDADITYNFSVLVEGMVIGDFMAVETLNRSIEVVPYKELGKNDAPHELIGTGNLGHVVLKWGLMNRGALWDWMKEVEVKGDFRRDVLIMHLTRSQIPVRTFVLKGAWPVRWSGANLDALSSTTAVEEIELSYKKLITAILPIPF